MELTKILQRAVELNASDLFIIPGSPVNFKVQGVIHPFGEEKVNPQDAVELAKTIYDMSERSMEVLNVQGDDDFSFTLREVGRFRCNSYRQRGSLAMTLRVVRFGLPDPAKYHIPEEVLSLSGNLNGMVLITGPAGSGKSTTLACLVDRINETRCGHIISIEDPIEFLHNHKKSLVSQREVPLDSPTFARALRAALRQAPDVIMLGEMRDYDTVHTAITAAETGHLLLSSLHTMGAAKTVDRIVDMFPGEQQTQIRVQLSLVLKAIVSQRLIPTRSGNLLPVFEMMTINPAIQAMIRDGRTHQIDNAILGGGEGMISMDAELLRLLRAGEITRETALIYALNPDGLKKKM